MRVHRRRMVRSPKGSGMEIGHDWGLLALISGYEGPLVMYKICRQLPANHMVEGNDIVAQFCQKSQCSRLLFVVWRPGHVKVVEHVFDASLSTSRASLCKVYDVTILISSSRFVAVGMCEVHAKNAAMQFH